MCDVVRAVLTALNGHSIVSVLGTLLTDSHFADYTARKTFVNEWESFLSFAQECSLLSVGTTNFCSQVYLRLLTAEIASLASKESGCISVRKMRRPTKLKPFL